MIGCKQFCTAMLREVREDAETVFGSEEMAKRFKDMYTESSEMFGKKKYFWAKDRAGEVLWEGTCCCSYQAKYRALNKATDRELETKGEYK